MTAARVPDPPAEPDDTDAESVDHWLYRCFDAAGELLYVGITSVGFRRFRDHGNDKTWWPQIDTIKLEHFPDRDTCHDAEIRAIRRERPRYNVDYAAKGEVVFVAFKRCRRCRQHFRPEPHHKNPRCPTCWPARRAQQSVDTDATPPSLDPEEG